MQFLIARNALLGTRDEGRLTPALRQILRAEARHLRTFLPFVRRTPILGFHGEAMEYLYNADSIEDKLKEIERTLAGSS
jgi:hypothetical protein